MRMLSAYPTANKKTRKTSHRIQGVKLTTVVNGSYGNPGFTLVPQTTQLGNWVK